MSAAIHALHVGVVALAPWQQLLCMCFRAFSVSNFVLASPLRERWTFSHTFPHAYVSAESWLQERETLSCKLCKPAGKICRAQRKQQDRSRWSCQYCQGKNEKREGVKGRQELCRSDFNFHDYLSLIVYKHISVDVGYKIMSQFS